jgi:hypothetical protein
VVESYVSNDETSAQGTPEAGVKETWPRISPRSPVSAAWEKDTLAEKIWPEVTVKLVADPMTAPLAFKNEMLPVQEAAVPVEDSVATFTTLIRAVSVLPKPVGGKSKVRGLAVEEVCAGRDNADAAARVKVKRSFRRDMLRLSGAK